MRVSPSCFLLGGVPSFLGQRRVFSLARCVVRRATVMLFSLLGTTLTLALASTHPINDHHVSPAEFVVLEEAGAATTLKW